MAAHPEPTREAGLAHLSAFMPRAGRNYARLRNFDFGPGRHAQVSGLSPWLRHRLVLEPEVIAQTLGAHGLSAAEKFVQEVVWRSYFKGFMEQRPSIWQAYRRDVAALAGRLEAEPGLRADYDAAVNGRTGIDCFDAWAGELVETGYLHNHARMWFASIWIFTLRLPWELGADFFLRHLLDGDPASNTLGWRWVGGLHTKGKTYLARPDNIAKYTEGRFNPAGQLATAAPPLREEEEHPLMPLPEPDVAVKPQRAGLVVTEEDCAPETLDLPAAPTAEIGLTATAGRSPLPVSDAACHFAHGAVSDALARGAAHFGVEGQQSDPEDWGAALLNWARANDLDGVMTAYAPVGPVAERLAAARATLAENGVSLIQILRPWDKAAWPHATKGFFKLKKQIPALIDAAGLSPSR
ncbi:FAD-binding domain-containing protein [Dichotomicrobium thermohalophilum]|uniref:Deoxyribodipyrimidine photo-lyase n=1 Tax=Dichotomicrobium thermohalophilum TaxID=933063 RepID=A0A397Q2W3_9HYPH|nr:FAD-binding domain-containing protein [Dichotomicrobium thermohalophilum]RIA55273.1 deoxyribodipyrimidine photo-lyase [Dichotomicrobium thermohalophilum]